MLTTAGEAACTAGAKLAPAADTGPAAEAAMPDGRKASVIETMSGRPESAASLPRPSQAGLSVTSTKSTATATVTACEKISQSLRMNDLLKDPSRPADAGVARTEVEAFLNAQMEPARFKDYGPNGLQVEGTSRVRKVASGVTASRAFIEAAIAAGADTLFVHHGLFWRGQDGRLTGWLRERVALLCRHDLNLFAYHLPLDAHPRWGNNAQLGQRLGWVVPGEGAADGLGRFGEQDLGCWADLSHAQVLDRLAQQVQQVLQRVPTVVPGDGRPVRRVAWCTGGAQGYFEAAIAAGADVYLTGEISEPQAHLARETGVAFIAAGHHATERYGAPAVAAALARHFGLQHVDIDVPNPA
jgi:dinuclear metal center YbgI/SA1388 family protein